MEFSKFIEWGFYGVISGGIFYLLSILKEMAGSINELNVNVAKVIEKVAAHEKVLDRHEESIQELFGK